MAGAVAEFVVKGRDEVAAAFEECRREVIVGIKPALLTAAKPIAEDAHSKTLADITHIGEPWSQFRIGATVHTVYVAPKRRRRPGNSPRPNLAPMLHREMEAAVARNQDVALAAMEAVTEAAAVESGLAV